MIEAQTLGFVIGQPNLQSEYPQVKFKVDLFSPIYNSRSSKVLHEELLPIGRLLNSACKTPPSEPQLLFELFHKKQRQRFEEGVE